MKNPTDMLAKAKIFAVRESSAGRAGSGSETVSATALTAYAPPTGARLPRRLQTDQDAGRRASMRRRQVGCEPAPVARSCEIAGGVLGRQHAELGAGCGRQTGDMPAKH